MKRPLRERLTASLIGLLTLDVLLAGLVFLVAFVVFFYLTQVVFVEHSTTFDQWAFEQLDAWRAAVPGLTAWVKGITFFGSLPFLVAAALLIPALLVWQNRRREALIVFLAIVGSTILNQLLKAHFHRLRPDTALVPQPGLSFPSGHAMIGGSLYAALAWVMWRRNQPVWAVALLLWAASVGLSRIYLHVHYATDVTAGFAAGILWMITLRLLLRKVRFK